MASPLRSAAFQRFWALAGAVSVRTKILGIVLGLVLVLGLSVMLVVRRGARTALEARLADTGVSLARDVSARSTDLVLIHDVYDLHRLLQTTRDNNPDLRYAFILDSQGRVIAHTFEGGFPLALIEANPVSSSQHHRTTVLETDEGRIWDTAVPILEGKVGVARVGMSDRGLRAAITALTGQLLLATAFVSAVGIAAAAMLTWLVTRPILQLRRAAEAVARGDLQQRVPRWAADEIGDLSEAFNSMVAALSLAAQERRERDRLRSEFVKAVILAQEDERKRIARELHDGASQSLTSLLIALRTLEESVDRDAPEALELRRQTSELRNIVTETLEEVHNLALALRPSVLDDLGLAAALEHSVKQFRQRFRLEAELAVYGFEDHRLHPTAETALYRITQEALTNVARHAEARSVSVLVERRDRAARVIVEDDGRGFDPDLAETGQGQLGLFGMRERVELLGGRLTIETAPGKGVSIFAEIPLDGLEDPEIAPLSQAFWAASGGVNP